MSGTENQSAAPAEPAGKRPVRRGRVAAVAVSVLVAGAVVAGACYTVATVKGADRDAGAPVWKMPKADAAKEKAPEGQGLAGMLVPYGYDNWLPGPDLAEFGADARLDGAGATALHKKSLRDLPRSQRKRLEKEIDSWRVEGMAMRSYTSGSTSVYSEEEVYTVGIVLTRMKDREAVRDLVRFQTGLVDALDVFRKGPKVKGHKNAKCFLPPKDAESDLDSMNCSAHVGDVLVTLTADGGKPLDTESVATLFGQQLDRIDEPGKAV
ncbi:hypothetical protein ABZ759_19120 [Streptomyces sp. NPDC047860]|uniref:hypothetical protein n=1 Tax=Streptomyces sp. NPDC047860 TaxID=3155743 RepID=UPI0034047087